MYYFLLPTKRHLQIICRRQNSVTSKALANHVGPSESTTSKNYRRCVWDYFSSVMSRALWSVLWHRVTSSDTEDSSAEIYRKYCYEYVTQRTQPLFLLLSINFLCQVQYELVHVREIKLTTVRTVAGRCDLPERKKRNTRIVFPVAGPYTTPTR